MTTDQSKTWEDLKGIETGASIGVKTGRVTKAGVIDGLSSCRSEGASLSICEHA